MTKTQSAIEALTDELQKVRDERIDLQVKESKIVDVLTILKQRQDQVTKQ